MSVQSKTYGLMLYPDCDRHKEIIDELLLNQSNGCDYVGILHDCDVYNAEDELRNSEHKTNTLKKPHYHIVLCYEDSVSIGQVQSRFPNLESNLIEAKNNRKESIRYLCHITDKAKAEGKHIYEQKELFGSPRLIGKYFAEDTTSQLEMILDYIYLASRAELNYTKLLRWCIEQGSHNTLRKYSFLIKEVMAEKLSRKSIIAKSEVISCGGVFNEGRSIFAD